MEIILAALLYTVIKTRKQYDKYCTRLEELTSKDDDKLSDEIELLTVLIEKWDDDHNTFNDADPAELLKFLMESNNLKAKDLVEILDLTKGTISKILNYQKGLSKETIRRLSEHFKISQEAFNRPYKLVNEPASTRLTTRKKNTGKRFA